MHVKNTEGFLGSIGGSAAILAQEYVKSLNCLEYPELEWKQFGKWLRGCIHSLMTKAITSLNKSKNETCSKCVK